MHLARQIAWLCIFVLQLSEVAYSAPGFLPVTDNTLPSQVVKASDRVYKLISQGGRLDRVVVMTDINQFQLAQKQFAEGEKWWQKTQLDFCIANKLEICPIFDQMGDGSAFTLDTPNSTYTNLHNFYEIISANYSLDKNVTQELILKRNLHAPFLFILRDKNGRSVVNTSKTVLGTLEFFNPSPALLGSDISIMNSALGRVSDIVRIHLVDTTASQLQIARAQPKLGDAVYLIGYPMETSDRSAVRALDSDGKSLRISVGKIISFEDWKQRTGNNFGLQEESLLKENMIFFDTDCEHGNSGGPLVNKNGEVVGIMMALYRDVHTGNRICGALNTMDEAKLTELWKSYRVNAL